MENVLELLIFVLLFSGGLLSFKVARRLGKGVANITNYSLIYTLILFALSRIFLFVFSLPPNSLSEVTLHVWWHGLAIFAFCCLIWAGYRQSQAIGFDEQNGYKISDHALMLTLIIFACLSFFIAVPSEAVLAEILGGSIIDTMGLHHFAVVVFGSISFTYLLKLRAFQLNTLFYPLALFSACIAIQHFWELVTESWHMINIPNTTVELIEQIIVIAALVFLNSGLQKSVKLLRP